MGYRVLFAELVGSSSDHEWKNRIVDIPRLPQNGDVVQLDIGGRSYQVLNMIHYLIEGNQLDALIAIKEVDFSRNPIRTLEQAFEMEEWVAVYDLWRNLDAAGRGRVKSVILEELANSESR